MALTLSLIALAVVLAFAMVKPRGWPEAVAAVPAAGLLIAFGVVPLREAAHEVQQLLPVVLFLAAVLVLAQLCDDEDLFRAAGAAMARSATGGSSLLAKVFVIGAVTTAVLSLDATVVLLTPVVLATTRALRVPARPHAYATAHLANTASLLLPVSNLTNLLAFSAAGLSFVHFTAVMTPSWLAAVAAEFFLLRWLFTRDLAVEPAPEPAAEPVRVPIFILVVLALTLVGFAVTSLLGFSPAWAALAAVIVLGVRALARRDTSVARIAVAADVPFLVFVLCLGVVVDGLMLHGLESAMRVVPDGTTLLALLGIAAVAAVLSNVVNNLPAVLVLLPLVAASGPAAVLAMLLGVNIGPNLTYVGSLANLLWRGVVRRDVPAGFREFSRIGLITTPVTLIAAIAGLWIGLRVFGV